ncbi:MAG TPA: isoaspartyl peptidase/L-asparaginase family protein [Allosphingosinicella sp.]|nr:isoaspartyl peptidase/L-asparaginase family protein [Allosphingosinicella sp.]
MSDQNGRWALIVHGGAKEISPEEEESNRAGCLEALAAGQAVLEEGGTAVDAVEASIRVLEALPVFNAGYGSVLNNQGEVEMCAAVMDGSTLDVGAVGAIKGVRHPVSVARTMLPQTPILLAGEGAFMFARDNHAELCDPDSLITEKAAEDLQEAHDTVGAVALDANGNLAAGTSTGGLTGALRGRMGDSPLPGCGYYADNHIGAVALSGHGEGIARLAAAAQIMGAIEHAGPEAAIAKALSQMSRVGGDAGGIAIDRQGRIGWWHNSPDFAVATIDSQSREPRVWLNRNEDV